MRAESARLRICPEDDFIARRDPEPFDRAVPDHLTARPRRCGSGSEV